MARALAAIPFFAAAAFFADRSRNPLEHGYFADYKDSPDGVYLTMAAVGLSLAALFAAAGLVVAWRWFRRFGFAVVAVLAVVAGVVPALLFNWASESVTLPWAYVVGDMFWWLRFHPRPEWYGLAIQAILALVAVGAGALQLSIWGISRRRPPGVPLHARSLLR